MTENPKVSILTPTYNQARYLGTCIQSVRNQSCQRWEQLVVDDGSTDSTKDVVEAFEDTRIKYTRLPHRGVEGLGEAYNLGLENASAEIIAILEGDDFWPPGKLDSQLPLFDNRRTVFSWGEGVLVSEIGTRMRPTLGLHKANRVLSLCKNDILPRLLWRNFLVPSSGVVVRREALKRIGGFHQPRGVPFVDAPTWLRLAASMGEDEQFVYSHAPVVYWRIHPEQISSDYERMIASRAMLVQEFFDLGPHNADLIRQIGTVDVRKALAYHWGRYFMAKSAWNQSLQSLRQCWKGECLPVKVQIVVATLSCLLRFDWFQVIPLDL